MRRTPLLLLVTFAILLQANSAWASNLTIHYIDIGQGDSTLILYQNWTILIDSGDRFNAQRDKMQSYLAGLNITTINLAIATHADADHIGQFTNIMNSLTVEEFWVNGLPHTSQLWATMNETIHNLSIPQRMIRRGNGVTLGEEAYLYALGPIEPLFGEQNSDSLVLRLIYHNISFLFTGDADERAEARMIEECGLCLGSDVIKLGHHGSSTSSSEEFLAAVWPYVGIISAGYENKYGHPHNETLARLAARNVTVFRTDLHDEFADDIIATTDGYELVIRQEGTGQEWAIQETALVMLVSCLAIFAARPPRGSGLRS